jgi:hypothetical protein
MQKIDLKRTQYKTVEKSILNMVNYQLGKIYKIVCRITGEVYVGSTCEPTLARRLVSHRSAYKQFYEKNKGSCFASFQIILRGDYYIDLLENFPCNSSDELRKREREYYDKIECINVCRPYLYIEEMKAERQLYDEIHKDVIREQQKKYNEEHRERINKLKLLNYHKNKKIPTEEELEAKALMKKRMAEHMRNVRKEKLEAKRLKNLENPNYEEEEKARRRELHRINDRNYRIRKAEKMKQMALSQT